MSQKDNNCGVATAATYVIPDMSTMPQSHGMFLLRFGNTSIVLDIMANTAFQTVTYVLYLYNFHRDQIKLFFQYNRL